MRADTKWKTHKKIQRYGSPDITAATLWIRAEFHLHHNSLKIPPSFTVALELRPRNPDNCRACQICEKLEIHHFHDAFFEESVLHRKRKKTVIWKLNS